MSDNISVVITEEVVSTVHTVVKEPINSESQVLTTVSVVGERGPQGPPGPPGSDGDGSAVNTHISSETPHPVYDDMPSLILIFNNQIL